MTLTEELFEYLNKVGSQYKPHRHQTIVLCMAKKFDVPVEQAETAVGHWLSQREKERTVN